MAGGRPTKYDDLDMTAVKKLATKGWTDNEMSNFFEIDRATWYRWKGKHAKFCDALKGWKGEADSRVERSLYERAIGYDHPEIKVFNQNGEILTHEVIKHYPPDTTSMIFWLKNRNPDEWRDKKDIDLNVSSHEEWLEKLAE